MSLVNEIFAFLRDHCTSEPNGADLFQERVSEQVRKSTLRSLNNAEMWDLVWEKPFYASISANIATNAVATAKKAKVFSDYRDLLDSSWNVTLAANRRLEKLGTKPSALVESGDLAGPCKVGFRLYAVVQLARTLDEVVKVHNQIRESLGADNLSISAVRKHAEVLSKVLTNIRGVGRTTALHILTDLGYPVPKTDIWLIRLAARDPVVQANVLKRIHLDLNGLDDAALQRRSGKFESEVFAFLDRSVAEFSENPLDKVNLDVMFRRYRFCELVIAKFGMGAEEAFGLRRSAIEALTQDKELRDRYPALWSLAKKMSH